MREQHLEVDPGDVQPKLLETTHYRVFVNLCVERREDQINPRTQRSSSMI